MTLIGQIYAGLGDFVDFVSDDEPPRSRVVLADLSEDTLPFPHEKFAALRANNRRFKQSWERTRRDVDLEDKSGSGYGQSIASFAAHAGWTDAEMLALLRHYHAQHGEVKGSSYYQHTITTARLSATEAGALAMVKNAEWEEKSHTEQLEIASQHFQAQILRIVRRGSRDDAQSYVFFLEGGLEVTIPSETLANRQREVRAAFFKAVGRLAAPTKAEEWLTIANLCGRVAEDDYLEEDSKLAELIEWLEEYGGAAPNDDWQFAVSQSLPYRHEGKMWVNAGAFHSWLKRTKGIDGLTSHDLAGRLRHAGFTREQVSAWHNERTYSKRYWARADLPTPIEPQEDTPSIRQMLL